MLKPIEWKENKLLLIDQRKLPHKLEYFICASIDDLCYAIKNMVVRGAPAIGVVTAFGVVLGLKENLSFNIISNKLLNTRPTANSIKYVLSNMTSAVNNIKEAEKFAKDLLNSDIDRNKRIGFNGKKLIKNNSKVLTHCNAGALATAGYGTALGVLKAAHDDGINFFVYVDETRPFFQGSRLTAYELLYENIDFTIICDSAAAFVIKNDGIELVIVGADRITGNGDVVNKIGTYGLAIIAKEHKVPFYIAAPIYTFDFSMSDGFEVPIEYRDSMEVKKINDIAISPVNAKALNPAFDITPANFITGYITEDGIYDVKDIDKLRSQL